MVGIDYRLHDGSLWCAGAPGKRYSLIKNPLWHSGRVEHDNPLTDGVPLSIIGTLLTKTVPLPGDDRHRRIAETVMRNASNCLLIGDRLHRRSTGPLRQISEAGCSIKWTLGIDERERRPQDARLFALPIHLQHLADEALAACEIPIPPDDSRYTPQKLIDFKQEYDALANAQEALAWTALWAVRRKTLDEMGQAVVESAYRLRQSLEERWPELELCFLSSNNEADMWPHARGRTDFPDGERVADLTLALLRDANSEISTFYHQQARLFECLRNSLGRQNSLGTISQEPGCSDHDELSSLRF